MDLLDIIVLAVLQGVTEPLPVSSSGHLVVAREIMTRMGAATTETPTPDAATLIVFLHVASALAFLVFFRRTVLSLFTRPLPKAAWRNVIAACVPVGVIGVVIKLLHWDDALETVPIAAFGFILSAIIVRTVSRVGRDEVTYDTMTPAIAFKIGLAQCVGVLPGVSRSGITIAAGLAQHVKGADAARFSFLIALPVILAAGALDAVKSLGDASGSAAGVWGDWRMWVGFVVCFAVTYAAVALLVTILEKRKFGVFAGYLLCASAVSFGLWATA
jgi:undecaprenyl-diphosphatase